MTYFMGLLDGGHEQTLLTACGLDRVMWWSRPRVIKTRVPTNYSFQHKPCPTSGIFENREHQAQVRGVSPRLLATGLLSTSASSAGVRIVGVIPEDERAVSLVPQRMVEGTYLTSTTSLRASLSATSWHAAQLKIGSKAVLMTQSLTQAGAKTATGDEMQSTLLRSPGSFALALRRSTPT